MFTFILQEYPPWSPRIEAFELQSSLNAYASCWDRASEIKQYENYSSHLIQPARLER